MPVVEIEVKSLPYFSGAGVAGSPSTRSLFPRPGLSDDTLIHMSVADGPGDLAAMQQALGATAPSPAAKARKIPAAEQSAVRSAAGGSVPQSA